MKLTKLIPVRTETLVITHLDANFSTYCERWRAVRSRMRNKLDRCSWCKKPFADGDVIGLVITDKGNKVLCQECVKEARESER